MSSCSPSADPSSPPSDARRAAPRSAPSPTSADRRRPDAVLVGGLAVVAAAALALRAAHLGAHLPHLVSPDEPTVMDRALALLDGTAPTEWDWPQGAMTVLAGVVGAVRALTPWGDGTPWLLGRVVFAAIAVVAVVLTGALGATLAGRGGTRTSRRVAAWVGAGLVAVSFLSVRLSRSIQPDHLQVAFVLGALLCALRYDADDRDVRDVRWLAAAGVLAGGAGAAKYLGVLVVVPAATLVVVGSRRRVRDLTVLGLATVAGFVALAWGALAEPRGFWDGLTGQFGHQAGGHLGYDGDAPGWWFHATRSLPGNWGWGITALAAIAVVVSLVDGDRRERAVAGFAVGLFGVIGLSSVEFPHYMVIVLPLLAALVGRLLARVADRASPVYALVALAGVALLAVPTLADDVRLVRAAAARDTRELIDPFLRSLDGPVLTENYAALRGTGTPIGAFGPRPDAAACGCFAVLSSYMEDRYRREPERYAAEVANYDRLRAGGTVVRVLGPRPRLAYNWDVLPRWGLGDLPLTGAISAVGPTITVLDLR